MKCSNNIINQKEIDDLLEQMINEYSDHSKFIRYKVRSFILKKQKRKLHYVKTLMSRRKCYYIVIDAELIRNIYVVLKYISCNKISNRQDYNDVLLKAVTEIHRMFKNKKSLAFVLEDGYVIEKITTQSDYQLEGLLMSNCLATQYYVNNHDCIFSLRDCDGNRLANISVKGSHILEVKGRGNKVINSDLKKYVNKFAKEYYLRFNLGFNDNVNFIEIVVLLYSSIGLFFTGTVINYFLRILAENNKGLSAGYLLNQTKIDLFFKFIFIPIFLYIFYKIGKKIITAHVVCDKI